MSVIAPPRPSQHSPDDLDALIKEARERARRRRRAVGAVLAALALIGAVGVYAGLALTRDTARAARPLPGGFRLVPARGPVSHARLTYFPKLTRVVDLARGTQHRSSFTEEVWFDPKGGLSRLVIRSQGRILTDLVHKACDHGFCIAPDPWSLGQQGYRWPFDPKHFTQVGTGSFHGRGVIWVEPLRNGHRLKRDFERVGFDAKTHVPFVEEYFVRRSAGLYDGWSVADVNQLPAKSVSFAVSPGGALRTDHDIRTFRARGLAAAGHTLGFRPWWLGKAFLGHRLRLTDVGTYALRGNTGHRIRPAPFVRFDYGAFTVEEYGAKRPSWFQSGPEPGRALIDSLRSLPGLAFPGFGTQPRGRIALVRHGRLVIVWVRSRRVALDRATALAVARTLRPLR